MRYIVTKALAQSHTLCDVYRDCYLYNVILIMIFCELPLRSIPQNKVLQIINYKIICSIHLHLFTIYQYAHEAKNLTPSSAHCSSFDDIFEIT